MSIPKLRVDNHMSQTEQQLVDNINNIVKIIDEDKVSNSGDKVLSDNNYTDEDVIKVNLITTPITTITVKLIGTSGVDADFCGNNAIQDAINSITDATINKQYIIIIGEGCYSAIKASNYTNDDGIFRYSFVNGKDYIHLKGIDRNKVIISGYLPDKLETNFRYDLYQTIMWNCNANIENVTAVGQNLRYPIHIEGSTALNWDINQLIINCNIRHVGNTNNAATVWNSYFPIGLGLANGQELTVENCWLISPVQLAMVHHSGIDASDGGKPATLIYKRCKFSTYEPSLCVFMSLGHTGTNRNDNIIFEDCQIPKFSQIKFYSQFSLNTKSSYHIPYNVKITGGGYLLHQSNLKGLGLKITSATMGTTSTVRFDETCSAFPYIIGDGVQTVETLTNFMWKTKYGYYYKNGGGTVGDGYAGKAVGGLDIDDSSAGKSLGVKLGDCSVTNKVLVVVIDGVTKTITFNTNLTAASNATIIGLINTAIGAAGTCATYCIGKEYYPDVEQMQVLPYYSTGYALAGMVVTNNVYGGFVKANEYALSCGILLDDVAVGELGRVLWKGVIWTNHSDERFSVLENTGTTVTAGDKLGVPTGVIGKVSTAGVTKFLNAVGDDVVEII